MNDRCQRCETYTTITFAGLCPACFDSELGRLRAIEAAAREVQLHEMRIEMPCDCIDIPRPDCCTCGAYEAANAMSDLRAALAKEPGK